MRTDLQAYLEFLEIIVHPRHQESLDFLENSLNQQYLDSPINCQISYSH